VNWSLMPGVLKVPIRTSNERARRPASSSSSRRAVAWSASPSTSQGARRRLEHHRVHGGPVLADQRHPPVGVDGNDGTARGGDDRALEGLAVGVQQGGLAHREDVRPQDLDLGDRWNEGLGGGTGS